MRPTLLVLGLLLVAGCGGPDLVIRSHGEDDEAKVFFRPTKDADGNQLGAQPETMIGEVPTDWDVPENLVGGQGTARVVYEDGSEKDVTFTIAKDRDTVVTVTRPIKAKK